MEIAESTKIIFYVARAFGLAPFKIYRKTPKGRLYFQKSLLLSIYSAVFVISVGE